jgi:predicted acylesterase/phospholipase RssA
LGQKEPSGPKFALVLGSGGVRGTGHAGSSPTAGGRLNPIH